MKGGGLGSGVLSSRGILAQPSLSNIVGAGITGYQHYSFGFLVNFVLNIPHSPVPTIETYMTQVLTCFGNKIIENVPPLNFLSRISDVLTEFLRD